MPEKSRQQRVKIAKRQGKATAIKSSDVGRAKGLSRHAAKKSRHVEGMRSLVDRSVSRKMPPHMGKGSVTVPNDRMVDSDIPRSIDRTPRLAGIDRGRAQQRVLSRRSPSQLAAKQARLKKR